MTLSLARDRVVLLAALGAAFMIGMLMALVADEPRALDGLGAVASLAATILVATWCQEDSRSRNVRVGKPMLWLLVLTTPLGFLVYLFRSRRPVQAVFTGLLSCLFVGVLLLLLVAGAVAGVLLGEAASPAYSA